MRNAKLRNYCYNESDWYKQIEELILDKQKRKLIGNIGKKFVEKNYSNKKIIYKWDTVYKEIIKNLN